MTGRLVGICLVQAAIVALLAFAVFGADGPSPRPVAGESAAAAAARAKAPVVPAEPLASAAGDSVETNPATIRAAVAAQVRPDDPVGVLLMGRVLARDGTPAQANVGFLQGSVRRFATAEADGTYAVAGLQPGTLDVTLRGAGIVEATETITLDQDAIQYRDFTCGKSIAVQVRIVTPDGQDATKAMQSGMPHWVMFGDFTVVGQQNPLPDRIAPTDSGRVFVGDAQWRQQRDQSGGIIGTLHLSALPAHVAVLLRHLVLQKQVVQPGQQLVEFVVDLAALDKMASSATVRIVDEHGAPLQGIGVRLDMGNSMGPATNSDESGRVEFVGRMPGWLRLSVHAKDRESVAKQVHLEPGQRVDLGDLQVGPAMPLVGTVVDFEGKPVGGSVTWTELKWRDVPTPFRTNHTARVDAEGKFSLWGTGRGRIAVQVRSQDGRMAAGVFDNPPVGPVVLRLDKPGECTVTRPADPTRSFVVTLFDGRRQPVHSVALDTRASRSKIHLPAGEYTFEVHDERQQLVHAGSLTFGETPCAMEIR